MARRRASVPGAFGLGLSDPADEGCGLSSGVESGPVSGQLAVAVNDLGGYLAVDGLRFDAVGAGCYEFVDRGGQVGRPKLAARPSVERAK